MTIKNKLRAGISFLFLLASITCGLSIYFLNKLSADAGVILKDNYETLKYVRNIGSVLSNGSDKLNQQQLQIIELNINKQEHNVTEAGEQQLTDSLYQTFLQLRNNKLSDAGDALLRGKMRALVFNIMQINMAAIETKNAKAKATAHDATLLVALTGSFLFLLTFSFIVNFPGYIANPIKELTEKIKAVSNRNYKQQLNFNSNDEFGELSDAFNSMTRKLNEYENTSLASILFEKKRIETIINSMNDAIIGIDEKNLIIFANEVACKLMGVPSAVLVGHLASQIALENDLLRNLLVNEQTKMKIFTDNKPLFFSRENVPVISDGRLIGNVIILKNVTEYQQLDEAKTNFIATISHELKTPISSIKMSLKLLQDARVGVVNDEQERLIENIEDDTHRLLQITAELLDMSQVETGKIQLNFGSTHPANIVNYAVKAIQFIADQRQVTINVSCDDKLPNVRADLDKTTWVLINLLSNAIKYSNERSAVTLTVKKAKHNEVLFEVADQGPGIEQQYLDRIFERYFKVPDAKTGQAGTGLGLAIAKDFIEAQAGTLHVKSELGVGSSFDFTLKVAK